MSKIALYKSFIDSMIVDHCFGDVEEELLFTGIPDYEDQGVRVYVEAFHGDGALALSLSELPRNQVEMILQEATRNEFLPRLC